MAKIKINELAVQVNKKSSEVISVLEELGEENNGKRFVATSSIDEKIAQRVKERLGVKIEKPQEPSIKKEERMAEERKPKQADTSKTDVAKQEPAAQEAAQDAPKKKIFMVSNPQNSSQAGRNGRRNRQAGPGQRNQRPARNGKPSEQQARQPQMDRIQADRPQADRSQIEKQQADKHRTQADKTATQKPAAQQNVQNSSSGQNVKNEQRIQNEQKVQNTQNTHTVQNVSSTNTSVQNSSAQSTSSQRQGGNAGSSNNTNNNRSNTNNNYGGGNNNGVNGRQQRQNNRGENQQRQNNNRYDNRSDNRFDNRNDNRNDSRNDNRSESRGDNRNDGFQRSNNNTQQRPNINRNNSQRNNRPEARLSEVRATEIMPEKKPDSRRAEKFQDRDRNKDRDKNSRQEKQISQKSGMFKKPEPVKQEMKEPEIKVIQIGDSITIKELAEKMKLQASVIVKKMFMQGKMLTINQEVDFATAEEIALEFEVIVEQEEKVDVIEELLKEEEEDESTMIARPPVICVMGHVDHGKTSLLDAIRSTNVTSREAGGITQHIGAYVVEINGQGITFLDTPGHEAFTAMRMRGAQSTDIAVLVVAADDGVMPQTIEAINHAKAAGIEIIVAINKIDKPSANIDRVKQELIEYELVAEDWGGSTVFVPVSAHTGEGIENLLEMILLTAEVKELKANPKRKARGLVIEAQLDKGKGPVATVLVQKGTLHVGDVIAAGSSHGKVRAMIDDKGRRVKEALPSTPVEILGLNDVPNAGEIFVACENEKEARSFAETFISQGKEKLLEETRAKMSLDDLFSKIQAGSLKELNIIVKADVQGSVEAMRQSLLKLSNEEVIVKVIHGGVGAINESDVILASASNAIIIGFNVKPDNTAKSIAERENVDVRLYRVIYNAIEDVEAAMKGMLEPVFAEKVIGHAEVRQTFKSSGVGMIAGSYILDGKFQRGCSCRVSRDGEVLFDGALASLKRFKDDVKEVNAGYECGLVFEKFGDLQEGDQIEAYIMEEVPR